MNGDMDTSSVRSDEERVKGFEKMENFEFSEKRVMNLGDWSENDVKSNASSSSRRRVFVVRAANGAKMKSKADKWLFDEHTEVDEDLDELNRTKMEEDFEYLKLQSGDENGLSRSGENPERKIRERVEIEGWFQRAQGIDIERRRYTASKYSEEGPSDYYSGSDYRYRDSLDKRSQGHGFDKVDYTGANRAELLRKLDDLTDQLRRSGEFADNPKRKNPHRRRIAHHDPYSGSEDWFSDSSSGMNRPFTQFPGSDQHVPQPSYMNHYAEPSAYISMDEFNSPTFYPPAPTRNHVQGVQDPLRSQMSRSSPHAAPTPFQQQRSHGYFSGHHLNKDMVPMDPSETFAPDMNNHNLSCPCYFCYNKNQVPQPHISTDFGGKRLPGVQTNPVFYHHENFSPFGPHDFDPRIANMPPLKSHNLGSHSRWRINKDSEEGSFVPQRPPRIEQAKVMQFCRPMTGGAPMLTCYNCFELLQVPNKVLVKYSNPKKLRCGVCSTIIVLGVSNKRVVFPVREAVHRSAAKVAKNNHIVGLDDDNSNARSQTNQASMTFSSEDYNHSAYDFQSMDRELIVQKDHPGLANAKMESLHSTSSCTSEDEANLNNLAASKQNSNRAEMLMKDKSALRPPAGSSSQNNFEYLDKYHKRNHSTNGNTSRHFKQQAVAPNRTTSGQNSMVDTSEATEIEISSNEFGNTGSSLDSGEASGEGNRLRANKAAESFFAGIPKTSFRNSDRSHQNVDQEMANVTVNGHLIPARLIEKAEKFAGPIQPGHYWYDFRAGFWGMMGSPCLGIVPPFIEEFHYPLPENCADGNTSVFVNGRELHQKDLNLLASRGLPRERNRSYIVEISGRVLDEHTGEELESLGKLAPTIERAKRGVGMKPPKAAA